MARRGKARKAEDSKASNMPLYMQPLIVLLLHLRLFIKDSWKPTTLCFRPPTCTFCLSGFPRLKA